MPDHDDILQATKCALGFFNMMSCHCYCAIRIVECGIPIIVSVDGSHNHEESIEVEEQECGIESPTVTTSRGRPTVTFTLGPIDASMDGRKAAIMAYAANPSFYVSSTSSSPVRASSEPTNVVVPRPPIRRSESESESHTDREAATDEGVCVLVQLAPLAEAAQPDLNWEQRSTTMTTMRTADLLGVASRLQLLCALTSAAASMASCRRCGRRMICPAINCRASRGLPGDMCEGLYCDDCRYLAARKIAAWATACLTDPAMAACRRRLLREFEELASSSSSQGS